MKASGELIATLEGLGPADVGASVGEFLERIGGPAWLRLPGRDRSRVRAFVTLMHGNEPSGVRALHTFVRSQTRPSVDLVCFIGAVGAALGPPAFFHRALPSGRDLNRCCRAPFEGAEGQTAAELLRGLRSARPEALIDLHNTSGSSPAYGVSTRLTPAHEVLTSLFARHLILTDLRLGALMEATEDDFPTVTIECGGVGDPQADAIALGGLERYATLDSVLVPDDGAPGLSVHRRPIRVELRRGARVAFDGGPVAEADVTLPPDVDRHNFGIVEPGQVLGWLGPRGVGALTARDGTGRDLTRELFTARDGGLLPARPLKLLMVTTNPRIAVADCLFYVIDPSAG